MADVQLKKVQKSYGDAQVLRDIDLEVRDGEFMVFVGPSGCGKSTVSKLLMGLYEPWSGEILFDGKPRTALMRLGVERLGENETGVRLREVEAPSTPFAREMVEVLVRREATQREPEAVLAGELAVARALIAPRAREQRDDVLAEVLVLVVTEDDDEVRGEVVERLSHGAEAFGEPPAV